MKRERYSSKEQALRALLRARRLELGFRQEDLAHILGLPQSFVSKYESGERMLSFVETISICKALSIDPIEFLRDYLTQYEA